MNSITLTINVDDMNDATFEALTGMKKGEKLLIPEHIRQAKNMTAEEFIREIIKASEGQEPSEEFKRMYCLKPIEAIIMREVFKNLYCGKEIDFNIKKINFGTISQVHGWAIVHAAKEPYHRQFVGYTTRGCPKDSPEYLWAERGNRLALNIVDAPSSSFFDKRMIDKALDFIEQKLGEGLKILVHCNEGMSRSPSICLLYLIKHGIIKGDTLEDCEAEFMKVYPEYNPGPGMRGFVKEHWREYMV